MGLASVFALLFVLVSPLASFAANVQACAGSTIHYLLVRPTEDLAGGPDQEVFKAFAKETGAQFTAITPDELNAVAKDKYRRPYVMQLLNNLTEIRRRIKSTKDERSLESLIAQKDRNLEELRAFQPERQKAVRELLPLSASEIKKADPKTKIILLYSGHGLLCEGGQEWCAEVAPGQVIREREWMAMAQADGAIFDSNFMANGMDLYASPSRNRVYGLTTDFWDLEEAGKGLISTALFHLLSGPPKDICLLDFDRDGKINLSELSGFMATAFAKTRRLAGPHREMKSTEPEICVARPVLKTCPLKTQLANIKTQRLFKHPEVLPPIPVQRTPSSASPTGKLDN